MGEVAAHHTKDLDFILHNLGDFFSLTASIRVQNTETQSFVVTEQTKIDPQTVRDMQRVFSPIPYHLLNEICERYLEVSKSAGRISAIEAAEKFVQDRYDEIPF